jgi:hypothetical protein
MTPACLICGGDMVPVGGGASGPHGSPAYSCTRCASTITTPPIEPEPYALSYQPKGDRP